MAQITGGAHRGHAAGDNDIEKAASQLASDTKYKVKKRMGANVSRMAPAAVTKAYLAQLAKSPAPGPVKSLAQKKLTGGLKEEYDIDSLASDTIANAMFKVFVEGIQEEPQPEPEIQLSYLNQLIEDTDAKKYKIVVTDKKTGNQYRRMATREKIAELRANPNIQSVELSSYGEPIGSEKKSGEQTAKVKSGKGLDYDGDGKVESGAKEHAGAVHNAIQRKKGGTPDGKDTSNVKEDVEAPVAPTKRATKGQNDAEIVSNEEKGMDNTKLINVFPELKLKETTYGKFLNMIQEKTLTDVEEGAKVDRMVAHIASSERKAGKSAKESENIAWATANKRGMLDNKNKKVVEEAECDTEKKDGEEDPRSMKTKVNLVKNKLRSGLGIKNPIVMVATEEAGDGYIGPARLGIKNPLASDATRASSDKKRQSSAVERLTKPGQRPSSNMFKHADELDAALKMYNHYEPEGEVVSEEESDRQNDRAREGGDWRSRSERPSPRRRRPSMAGDPRYGSVSDEDWASSSHNPANKRRR
jgi:hypothetical protein